MRDATSYKESHTFNVFPSTFRRKSRALDAKRIASSILPCCKRMRDRTIMSPENLGFPVFKNVSSVKSLSDGHLLSISSASSGLPIRRRRLDMLLYELPIRSL